MTEHTPRLWKPALFGLLACAAIGGMYWEVIVWPMAERGNPARGCVWGLIFAIPLDIAIGAAIGYIVWAIIQAVK